MRSHDSPAALRFGLVQMQQNFFLIGTSSNSLSSTTAEIPAFRRHCLCYLLRIELLVACFALVLLDPCRVRPLGVLDQVRETREVGAADVAEERPVGRVDGHVDLGVVGADEGLLADRAGEGAGTGVGRSFVLEGENARSRF